MFCRLGIYRRYGGTACHCSCTYELQLGRLEWLELESSGSFLIYIYLLPGLALAQLELLTPTCNFCTVCWFRGRQTFFFFLIVLSLYVTVREGSSCCGARALERCSCSTRAFSNCRVWAWLSCSMCDLSSQTKGQSHIPCIER